MGFKRDPHVLWRNTQRACGFWSETLNASTFVTRAIKFGVYELPIKTSLSETRFSLPQIPVEDEDLSWLREELGDALRRRIYEEIPRDEALRLHRTGFPLSNAFIVHQPDKRRLVVNLSRQSELFSPAPVTMETLESFALELQAQDHLMSFDIEKGYHHFRLHPKIRNWFLFKLDNRFFRCIALPFGWSLSPPYFIKMMRPFVRYIRNTLRLRIHPYMDDFLVAVVSHSDLPETRSRLDSLLTDCGLARKVGKGCWEGSQRIEHLGFIIDTKKMVFGITPRRMEKIKGIARKLLSQARRNRRLVEMSLLRHFNGVAI